MFSHRWTGGMLLAFGLSALLAFGWSLHAGAPVAPEKARRGDAKEYVIEPLDILTVTVPKSLPDAPLSGKYRVHDNGKVRLGLFGAVPVEGLTLDEATGAIEKHLGQFINGPKVAVELWSAESKIHAALEEVQRLRREAEARRVQWQQAEGQLRLAEGRLAEVQRRYGPFGRSDKLHQAGDGR